MNLFELVAKLSLDDKEYKKGVDGAKKGGEDLDKSNKKLGSSFLSMGKVVAGVAVGALGLFIKNSIGAASEVEEMESKFTAVFSTMGSQADKWAKDFSESIGRNKNDIKGYLATQSDLMQGFGMTEEASLGLAQSITSLAFDLGSFNNVADDEAVLKLQKAIMGLETSGALESLGVDLTETTMKTSEFTKATGKSWEQLSRTEKMEVRYQEAMKQSSRAVGDAVRTADGYANSTKALGAKIQELSQTVGKIFLPFATKVVQVFKELVQGAINLVTPLADLVSGTGEVGEEFKWLGDIFEDVWFSFIQPIVDLFNEHWQTTKEQFLATVDDMQMIFRDLGAIFNSVYNEVIKPVFDFFIQIVDTLWQFYNNNIQNVIDLWQVMADALNNVYQLIIKPVFDFVMGLVEKVWGVFEEYMPEIQRVVDEVFGAIQTFWYDGLKPALEAIGTFLETVLFPIWDKVFTHGILPVVRTVFDTIIDLWDNSLKPILKGITDFISGVFSGDWSKAWEGIRSIFSGIWDGLGTLIKAPINAMIGIINSAIQSVNKFKIPDWVPVFGGMGVDIPEIKKLASGTEYFNGGLALVGEQGQELINLPKGSQVFNAEETRNMMNGLGNITLNIYSPTPLTPSEVARQTKKSLQDLAFNF